MTRFAIGLLALLLCASCAPDGDRVSWEGDQLTPQGHKSLDVDVVRFGDTPVELDVPVLSASYQMMQVAADGTSYWISGSGLEVGTSQFELPAPEGLQPLVLVASKELPQGRAIAYNLIDEDAPHRYESQIRGQRVALIRGSDEAPVETINLQDYGVESDAAIRADLAVHTHQESTRLYVGTGGALGGGAVSGHVFAVDLAAWVRGEEPVVAQFETVDGADGRCSGENTRSDGACGGGLHGEAAIKVRSSDDGRADVIIATGKGATDVLDGNFANGVLRLNRDLEFEPGCDTSVCDATGGASSECLKTCRNFFVPRDDGDSTTIPESLRDACSEAETIECLRGAAFDGSSAPLLTSFEREGLSEDPRAWIWAAPDGFVYVLGEDDWSVPVARIKYAHVCEVNDVACEISPHTPATTPIVWSEHLRGTNWGPPYSGEPVIWIPTYSPIEGVPGGLSQFDLVDSNDGATLVHLRSSPPRGSDAARTRFRYRPSRVSWGGVVESGEIPRFFRPFYYVNEDVRGVDIRLWTEGDFADAAYTRPTRDWYGGEWYFHARVGGGSSLEGLQVDHAQENPLLE